MSGTIPYHQLVTERERAAAKSVPSGKPAQGSATTGCGTQVSSASAVPKQPGNVAISTPNSYNISGRRIAGNIQGGVWRAATSQSISPAPKQPAVSTAKSSSATRVAVNSQRACAGNSSTTSTTPSTISAQNVVVNLPIVNLSSLTASPANSSRPTTPNKTVCLAPKTTNSSTVSAVPSSSAQAVSGPSTATAGTSLVTAASQRAGNSPRSNSAAISKPSPAV